MIIKLEKKRYKPGDIKRTIERETLPKLCGFIGEEELGEMCRKLDKEKWEFDLSRIKEILHKPYRKGFEERKISVEEAVYKTVIDKIKGNGKKNESSNEIAKRIEFMLFKFNEKYFTENNGYRKIEVKEFRHPDEILEIVKECNTCANPYSYSNPKAMQKKIKDIERWGEDECTIFLGVFVEDEITEEPKTLGYTRTYLYELRKNSEKNEQIVAGIDTTEINNFLLDWDDSFVDSRIATKYKLLCISTLSYLLFEKANKRKIDYILGSEQIYSWLTPKKFRVSGKLEKLGIKDVYSYTIHFERQHNRGIAADCISKHFLNYAKEILSSY